MPAPAWEGRHGAQATFVSRGTIVPLSPIEMLFLGDLGQACKQDSTQCIHQPAHLLPRSRHGDWGPDHLPLIHPCHHNGLLSLDKAAPRHPRTMQSLSPIVDVPHPRFPMPPPPWRTKVSLGGGGGDCKGTSRQSVVPSNDARKQNTRDCIDAVPILLMHYQCDSGDLDDATTTASSLES